jgi:hypothetical protein
MTFLNLDTPVKHNMILWSEKQIVCPIFFLTFEWIVKSKTLSKQPSKFKVMEEEEIHVTEALNPVNYANANLNEIVRNCKDLTNTQETKLFWVLKHLKASFQEKQCKLKGPLVSIQIQKGASGPSHTQYC